MGTWEVVLSWAREEEREEVKRRRKCWKEPVWLQSNVERDSKEIQRGLAARGK